MRPIQHILDEEAVLAQRGDEQLIDPFAHALAHRDRLAWRRGAMSCHHHASGRQALIQWQPASVKQLADLSRVHAAHAGCRWMSERTLEWGMLQDAIASPSRHQINACLHELRAHRRIAILPIEAIVPIASTCIGANPLAWMHLQHRGACADYLPALASGVAKRADRVASPFRCRKCCVAGQSPLACGLPGGINIKDDAATSLPVADPTNGFRSPTLGKALLREKSTKGF
jgi:hypothetical protein